MSRHVAKNRAWLLATARAVASRLKKRKEGTALRIRVPSRAFISNTDGWYTVMGDLGHGAPRMEIWLDRFSGYSDRKLYACFRSASRASILSITKRVSRSLWPVRVISDKNVTEGRVVTLIARLSGSEFNAPILEKYPATTFYGMYDRTRDSADLVSPHFCNRAVAFFEDVARAMPNASTESEHREVYPQIENRLLVASHLQRERSRLLAVECKIRDEYTCQVCGLHFAHLYGALGTDFIEAHHVLPLSRLRGSVRTKLEDLRAVCANCHRMLHRMEGESGDIAKLRAIVAKHRRR